MTWVFPHQVAYLARTKLSYVHLPRLLSDGKRDRSARVPGYVAIQLRDSCYLVFVRNGEPFHAVRLSSEQRASVPLTEVLREVAFEIERGEGGWIGYYGAPETQLGVMLATQIEPPLPTPREVAEAPAEEIVPALQSTQFTGIVEVADSRGTHYLCFNAGEYDDGFFSERDLSVSVPAFVRSIFAPGGGENEVRPRLYGPAGAELPEQASPALLNLYRRVMSVVYSQLRAQLGDPAAGQLATRISAQLSSQHAVFGDLAFRNGVLTLGDVVVSPTEIGEAAAHWIAGVLTVAAERGADARAMLRQATRNDRFALEESGFFRRFPRENPF